MGVHNYGFTDRNNNEIIFFKDVGDGTEPKWIWDFIDEIQDRMSTVDIFTEKDYNYIIPIFKKYDISNIRYRPIRNLFGKKIKFKCLD